MPTFFQKIQLALRGWSRRREEEAARKNAEFLQKSTAWVPATAPAPVAKQTSAGREQRFDREGLQVAFLEDSGQISYYLDLETGEVEEHRTASGTADPYAADPKRYRIVPKRSAASERDDRATFAETTEGAIRFKLMASIDSPEDFRRALSTDRGVERRWYNFKNDRAAEAIDRWLAELTS